jgi:hypothetical protein
MALPLPERMLFGFDIQTVVGTNLSSAPAYYEEGVYCTPLKRLSGLTPGNVVSGFWSAQGASTTLISSLTADDCFGFEVSSTNPEGTLFLDGSLGPMVQRTATGAQFIGYTYNFTNLWRNETDFILLTSLSVQEGIPTDHTLGLSAVLVSQPITISPGQICYFRVVPFGGTGPLRQIDFMADTDVVGIDFGFFGQYSVPLPTPTPTNTTTPTPSITPTPTVTPTPGIPDPFENDPTYALPPDVVALVRSRFGSVARYLRLRVLGQI